VNRVINSGEYVLSHPSEELSEQQISVLRDHVVAKLKEVYDPEIPVDIYELGLIYNLEIRKNSSVFIQMTLTSPACPVAESLPGEVKSKVKQVEGIQSVNVELIWDPPWSQEKMSEAAKLELGFI
jgi:FeS assembly SUF system protein